MEKVLPGTNKPFKSENAFDEFAKLIEITDGISLGQVCSITGLDQFVIQNWVKRGYVARPQNKKYYSKQLARILMINSLKESMKIEDIGTLMKLINGDVEDESDDLLSEAKLYSLFIKVIYNLKDETCIEETIKRVIDKEYLDNEKLVDTLDLMVHGYIAGKHIDKVNSYLKDLKAMKLKERFK